MPLWTAPAQLLQGWAGVFVCAKGEEGTPPRFRQDWHQNRGTQGVQGGDPTMMR